MFEIVAIIVSLLVIGIGSRVLMSVGARERRRLIEDGTLDPEKHKTGRS